MSCKQGLSHPPRPPVRIKEMGEGGFAAANIAKVTDRRLQTFLSVLS